MKLSAPRGSGTRPTSDRVKEALFNILSSRISLEGAALLDICAGTGALGIEGLSRGAFSCSFIEHDRNVAMVLERNVSNSRCQDRSELLVMDVFKALRLLSGRGRRYDVVFLDPPYNSALYATVAGAVCEYELMSPASLLIAECAARSPLPENMGGLRKWDRRAYGDTALEFYYPEGA